MEEKNGAGKKYLKLFKEASFAEGGAAGYGLVASFGAASCLFGSQVSAIGVTTLVVGLLGVRSSDAKKKMSRTQMMILEGKNDVVENKKQENDTDVRSGLMGFAWGMAFSTLTATSIAALLPDHSSERLAIYPEVKQAAQRDAGKNQSFSIKGLKEKDCVVVFREDGAAEILKGNCAFQPTIK